MYMAELDFYSPCQTNVEHIALTLYITDMHMGRKKSTIHWSLYNSTNKSDDITVFVFNDKNVYNKPCVPFATSRTVLNFGRAWIGDAIKCIQQYSLPTTRHSDPHVKCKIVNENSHATHTEITLHYKPNSQEEKIESKPHKKKKNMQWVNEATVLR